MSASTVISSTANPIRVLGQGFIGNGNNERARELVETIRIVCDDLTAEINKAARGKGRRE
jgi:hypothetical protein